uniref:Capping protein inhibiting regulator of actin dynamics n=1 Tax=Hucho hucho TaxID=62062 RepID=A0A4W5NNS0_9TELE
MFPKVFLQWCAALSSCAAKIERRRQGKFQPFRRLFGRRKKREAAERGFDAVELKASFSTGEVCNGVVSDDEETNQHLRELNPIGSRALSHDSVFIPEEAVQEPSPEHTMSQENVSDKVRNLQGASQSQGPSQNHGAAQTGTPSTQVKSPRSKRVLPATGTIESIDLDGVPQSVPRLDNTAAKHKLSVKPKNQRISRKHRRFTQDLQEVDIPGILQEETDAADVQYRTAEEETPPEKTKKQKLQEDERQESRRKRELAEQRHREEEEDRKKKAEEWRLRELEEERCRQQEEELIRKEEEERRQGEEMERRMKEEEERRIREEEERRQRELEEMRIREEEERIQREEEIRMREELELMQREEEQRTLEEEKRRKEEEERMRKEEEERKQRELEAERLCVEEEKRLKEAEEEEERKKKQVEEKRKLLAEEEEEKRLCAEVAASSSDPERKRRAEEVRWREMEERQRPFTFKVSSGEKQILFQKVNLTPVTPASSQQGGGVAEHREGAKASSPGGADSPTLPSSQYVPHTAILVTGAQLCGTAVNLDHIKETACKSLLGLADEKKAAMGTPPPNKSKTSPDRKSGKTKSLSESTDQSSAAILAEWASIRSKIFKGEGKFEEYPDHQSHSRPSSEDQSPFPHSNLRKTMSASAKFSITPARKKFADSNRNSEVLSPEEKEGGRPASAVSDTSSSASVPPAASPAPGSKTQSRGSKTVRIADGTGECMFAKDLPSFIVPSSSQASPRPEGSEIDAGSLGGESEDSDDREEGEEKGQPSPFGIKLRRTNYSLRFHSDQSTDKRKKRYSAGDSFDGVPSPLTPIDPDSDASVFSNSSSPASPLRESIPGVKPGHVIESLPDSRARAGKSPTPSMHSEGEKLPSKPSLYQRPSTSPKPATPPPSPLPKVGRESSSDAVVQRSWVGADSAVHEERGERRREETSSVAQLHRNGQGQSQGEEEPKEKRSFFPSISIPWREKADRKTELIRREGKPSLQSRHSLDSTRVQDKESGPLWITLALQKQKGFREQQQSRDERRSHREAKLSEKQTKDKDSDVLLSPMGSKGSRNTNPSKPQTPEETKRPDTLLGRLERRDLLKKANTLPSSVTVEIADSTPSPPAVKELTKRFPSTDSPQVSTEPAWLALAKRKAKAWSDCPQIIK